MNLVPMVKGLGVVVISSLGKGVFLFVFVAVGTLCGQEFMYCRTELGSGI